MKKKGADNPITVNREYLSVSEVSIYTGISERLLRDFLKDHLHPIPHYRVGKTGRIIKMKKDEIDVWIRSFKVQMDALDIDSFVKDLIRD